MTARHFAAFALLLASPIAAQNATRLDTASLFTLQTYARIRDPRLRELDYLDAQSRRRLENIASERKPSLNIQSQAQYQSTITQIPVVLPNGPHIPVPPHDTYDAHLESQFRLFDATISPRRAVDRAQTAEARARVITSVYQILQNINDAFFAALRADAQRAEFETTIMDLEAQTTVAATRVREGSALPSEERILRAELLRRRQSIAEFTAQRRASLAVLNDFTALSLDSTRLELPDLSAAVARAREELSTIRTRPEYAQFAASRETIERQRDARSAQDKPRVSMYGRGGFGRPGLNQLANTFNKYWIAGVQLNWTPQTWGNTTRDREVLALQQQIVQADEQTFVESIQRATRQDLETIDRLTRELASDDEIIALRESVAAEARARFTEAVITSAELVDRQTDVLSARLTRSVHRVELAQARAHLLTTLGIETR